MLNFLSKKSFVIVFGILLLMAIIFAVYWFLTHQQDLQQFIGGEQATIRTDVFKEIEKNIATTGESLRERYFNISGDALNNQDVSKCGALEKESDKLNCEDKVYQALFEKEHDANICKQMHNELLAAACYTDAAVEKKDRGICDSIESSFRKEICLDKITQQEAETKPSYAVCSAFSSEYAQKSCYINKLYISLSSVKQCKDIEGGEEQKQLCESIVILKQAYLNSDTTLCSSVADEKLRNYCNGDGEYFISIHSNFDRDKDGLTLGEEMGYGTSDDNSDSDKDGYQDGVEVRNGYNPAGAGKLEATK